MKSSEKKTRGNHAENQFLNVLFYSDYKINIFMEENFEISEECVKNV